VSCKEFCKKTRYLIDNVFMLFLSFLFQRKTDHKKNLQKIESTSTGSYSKLTDKFPTVQSCTNCGKSIFCTRLSDVDIMKERRDGGYFFGRMITIQILSPLSFLSYVLISLQILYKSDQNRREILEKEVCA